mmetsp:Transcript_52872/g.87598  ORF Transcript_52872/g.87598 Transcript_52872/m.87598 type:complete len:315 (-) Transcript_52872:310-1254(-)
MNVVFAVHRQVIIDHQRHGVHIDTARQQISRDQHTRGATAELLHNQFALFLLHIAMHRAHRKIVLLHLVRQPHHFAARVAINDRLRDRQRLVQIVQRRQLVILLLHRHVVLFNAVQRQLLLLHQDTHRITHKTLRQLQNLIRHGGAEQGDLHLGRQVLKTVVNLFLEAARQHLVRLVQTKQFQRFQTQSSARNHVIHTTWSTNHNLDASRQLLNVLLDGGTAHARASSHLHVGTQRFHYFVDLLRQFSRRRQHQYLTLRFIQIQTLQCRDGKRGSFACSRLRLRNGIAFQNDWQNTALLNRRRFFKAIRINTAQ